MAVNQPGCKALWDLMSLDHLPVFCMRTRHWKLCIFFLHGVFFEVEIHFAAIGLHPNFTHETYLFTVPFTSWDLGSLNELLTPLITFLAHLQMI